MIIGYLLIFAYILLLIFGLGPVIQRRINGETSRKFTHIMLFMVWVLIDRYLRGTIHQVIIPVIFIFLNLLSYKFHLYKSVERSDGEDNHYGTIYFALAITAIMAISYFIPEFYLPSGIAVMCLTFGDGFAALMGYNFRSRKISSNKSVMGFGAAVVASAAALAGFNVLYDVGLTWTQILALGLFTAILELVDYGLDNFTIVFGTFFLSYGFLHAPQERLMISVALALIIFMVIFFAHAIDYYGSLCSMVVVFCFSYFGGTFALSFLLASYFTVFFISAGKKHILHKKKEEHPRNAKQILINGGLGTLCILAYGITGQTYLLIVSIVSVGGCFVDSLSSDVGILSSRPPYDPLKRRWVEPGISGGMSVLGTVAAFLGSAVIAFSLKSYLALSVGKAFLITAVIFGQTLVDTILGSWIQVKYRCPVCGVLTEKVEHCGKSTILAAGISWVDNNMINLLSSIIVTALALLLF